MESLMMKVLLSDICFYFILQMYAFDMALMAV